MRWIRLIVLGAAALLLIVPGMILGPYALRVRRFVAEPATGYHAVFYLYVSSKARRAGRAGAKATLLVQPNNSGINSDDPAVHRRDAWWTGFGRHWVADELGVVLLVPAFVRPGKDWKIYTHALDRDALTTERADLARPDLQLLAMVDRARAALADEGLPVEEKFLIQGYSASAMFANRFTALHPRRVRAVAAGAPGGWPIAPVAQYSAEALPYPAGVSDLETITGQAFDPVAYGAVPQLLFMGSLDDNDSVDFRDGWDKEPAAIVERLFGANPIDRWDDAEAIYRTAGADARFVMVEGVGHDRKQLEHLATEFFTQVLGR